MNKQKKIGVIILGATGYGGGELLRLFLHHPEAEVVALVSSSAAGKGVADAHPHLAGFYAQRFTESFDATLLAPYEYKVVFSALPHGESGKRIESIRKLHPEVIVIDLSGDLRVKDEAKHGDAYPHSPFLPEIRKDAVYGLSELFHEEIRTAKVIANPGCLATAAILALAPLGGLDIAPHCSLNLATGSSGAGKDPKATTHHPVRHANFFAYKPLQHQHLPEIQETLTKVKVPSLDLAFVPHSLPVSRGIMCTAFITANIAIDRSMLLKRFNDFYAGKKFIRIKGEGCAELENIVGSNLCEISIATSSNTIVIHAAIDNLVKGMAGQAIQNMNIRCRLPETTGIWTAPIRPI